MRSVQGIMSNSFERLKRHYEPRIHPEKEGYQILDWEDQSSQRRRFDALIRAVDLAGKRLLDLGCGVGDLCLYLEEKKIACEYTGVDILDCMIGEACRRCEGGRFLQADLLTEEPFPPRSFDVVFCSGIFNLETGDNRQLLTRYLGRLPLFAGEAVVINLLSVNSPDRQERYHYFDPHKVREEALKLYRRVEIDQGYLKNDFTLVCRESKLEPRS